MPAIHEPITQAVGQAASVPAHPEEIRAKVKLRLGKRSRLNATLRTTPAGLVTAGGRHFCLDRRLGAGGAPALLADLRRR
jgi:hypothetical protein